MTKNWQFINKKFYNRSKEETNQKYLKSYSLLSSFHRQLFVLVIIIISITNFIINQASQYLEANKMADDLDFFNQYLESLSNNLK